MSIDRGRHARQRRVVWVLAIIALVTATVVAATLAWMLAHPALDVQLPTI